MNDRPGSRDAYASKKEKDPINEDNKYEVLIDAYMQRERERMRERDSENEKHRERHIDIATSPIVEISEIIDTSEIFKIFEIVKISEILRIL